MKTCDTCKHYEPASYRNIPYFKNSGECKLMEIDPIATQAVEIDRARGNDFVNVGPKFGCIHWATPDPSPCPAQPD